MKLRALALPLILLYPFYVGIMVSRQQQFLFPESSDKHYPLAVPTPPSGRSIELPVSFGNVRAFYQPAHTHSDVHPAIVYSHGNFECIQDSFALVKPLVDAGVSVLQVEFPGFCGADGSPSFANIIESETAAYDWLASQADVDRSRIVAMGYSIGGGATTELIARRPVRALLLLSTFTAIADMAHRYALPAIFIKYPFDNLHRLHAFSGPVFIEHGTKDQIIPFAMGQALAASKSDSEFVALDCGHGDCHFDTTLFAQRVPAWLAAQGILGTARD